MASETSRYQRSYSTDNIQCPFADVYSFLQLEFLLLNMVSTIKLFGQSYNSRRSCGFTIIFEWYFEREIVTDVTIYFILAGCLL